MQEPFLLFHNVLAFRKVLDDLLYQMLSQSLVGANCDVSFVYIILDVINYFYQCQYCWVVFSKSKLILIEQSMLMKKANHLLMDESLKKFAKAI